MFEGIPGLGGLDIMGGVSQVFFILQMVIGMAVMGGLVLYISFTKQFKHPFRIKEIINGRKIIYHDKAREFKDSEGVVWWQLYKRKQKIAVPPPEAIELDNRGRKCVDAYKTESGEYIYAIDKTKVEDIPKNLLEIKDEKEREKKIEEWKEKNKVIDAFQPYTTKQRLIMISEHKKALMKQTKKWQDYIVPIAAIASLTIVVIALMVFYGDMGKPLLEMGDKLNAHATIQKEQLEVIKSIKYDVQTLKEEKGKTIAEAPN